MPCAGQTNKDNLDKNNNHAGNPHNERNHYC